MFFETRSVGQKSRGHLIKQNIVAVSAIIEAIASGKLVDVDEERWDEIPDRGGYLGSWIKWPNY